ncbi:E-selectin [Spea bombifrons]|uniref:E-selectin n=1 Tax=Spea bombifrons TaxID=233779 RepID=UPI00234B6B75|nr:E-selectin [Spea bombifrons]
MIYPFYFSLGIAMLAYAQGWSYFYSPVNMTYENARQYCKNEYTDLVAIQNRAENEYLNNILPFNPTYYWIGIRKLHNQWTWVGTKKVLTEEAKNWATNEPNNKKSNEDCVEMYVKRSKDEGKWNDEPCTKKKVALCYTAACHSSSCSGHGECIETINNYTCKCHEGFYGAECENVLKCPPIVDNEQGFVTCSHIYGNFTYNSSCKFTCPDGFVLNGSDTIHCTTLGEWTDDIPHCEAVTCPALLVPPQASMDCDDEFGKFKYNSRCSFRCNEGFILTGSESIQCFSHGSWSSHTPTCQAISCPDISVPEQASMDCEDEFGEFKLNSNCSFKCNEGFILVGSESLQCSSIGSWSFDIPTCQAVQCSYLKPPVNGQIECQEGSYYNSKCTFTCAEGFKIAGASDLKCLGSGEWTSLPPICEALECEALQIPDMGRMNCTHPLGKFKYGSQCKFACGNDLLLKGTNTLECDSAGKWSAPLPTCKAPRVTNNSVDTITIGVAAGGASVLSAASLVIWMIKRLRKNAKKFTPSSSCQSLEAAESGSYQNIEEYVHDI